MKDEITIFTDGASRGNPGPGGYGAVLIFSQKNQDGAALIGADNFVVELGGREELTTNNRMELMAAIKALEQIQDSRFKIQERVLIYSDSAYLINGITKWIHGWKKKGWITSAKEPVENRDLWESLDELGAGKNIEWKLVGGHVGVAGNVRCDEIATSFADNRPVGLYEGSLSNYPIKNILDVRVDADAAELKKSGRSRSRAAAYSYVSRVDGKVKIHKNWAECEKRVKGVSGARFQKSLNAEDEAKIIREWKTPDPNQRNLG